jgi:hypothetical protein
MYWNYRVMKENSELGVYAVYYDDSGNIEGWSEKPFSPTASNLEELKTTLELMRESLKKEIIDIDSMPEDEK